MSWFLQASNRTESAKEHAALFVAVSLAFPSGTLRFWSGLGDLSFGGNSWVGAGDIGKIDVKTEHARLVAETRTYSITGVNPLLASENDIDNCFGRDLTEYMGFLDVQLGVPVTTPEITWEGRMGVVKRVFGQAPVIEVNAEHRLALIDQADSWRYTHEHQQQFYAGDLGFREASSVDTTEVLWGGFRVQPGGGPGFHGPNRPNPP